MLNINDEEIGIVNANKILYNALDNHYAIAHVNANNLEWVKSIIEVAVETNSPIIIGFSMSAIEYMGGYNCVVDIVRDICFELNRIKKIPIVIHLDHGNYEGCLKAIDAGFTSIMFDGSSLSFEENFFKTKQLRQLTTKKNISLEAEIGKIGANKAVGELADIKEAIQFETLKIDSLAVGIGNIHGIYPKNWLGLDFSLLAEIHNEMKNLPLVLHGGTGIDDEQIKKAISLGIAKININTECQLAFQNALREYFGLNLDINYELKGYDPRKIIGYGIKAVKKVIVDKLELFKSYGVNV